MGEGRGGGGEAGSEVRLDSEIRAFQKFFYVRQKFLKLENVQVIQGCSYKPAEEPNTCGFGDDSHPL